VGQNVAMFEPLSNDLDFQLLQNGAVTLYYQTAILDQDLVWLRDNGYQVETIDCRELPEFKRLMSVALKFKAQFGYDEWNGNLDALNDAFRELEANSESGFAICFLRYDLLTASEPLFAEAILDIIERNSRDHLLLGRRFLALVQSDDPRIRFNPLGARQAQWNRREWLNKNRGL
jgi:hypothetical protein